MKFILVIIFALSSEGGWIGTIRGYDNLDDCEKRMKYEKTNPKFDSSTEKIYCEKFKK